MRLTHVLLKHSKRYQLKKIWQDRGKMKIPTLLIPPALQKTNVSIHDPVEEYEKKPIVNYPDEPILEFGLDKEKDITEYPDYHEVPILTYNKFTRLLLSQRQAQSLTKTLIVSDTSLPEQSQENVGKLCVPRQDELMQRFIMQANVWDPTREKLPKRLNKELPGWKFKREFGIPETRIVHNILRNLVRLMEMSAVSHPSLMDDRALATEAYVSMNYNFQGTPIQILGDHEYLVSSRTPLAPFANEDEVDQTTVRAIPDIFPVHPTLDLDKRHRYTMDNITPWNPGASHPHPHTLIINNYHHMKQDQRNTVALMYMFAHAMAEAKRLYGMETRTLPSPISMQCIMTDMANFNLYAFQLNTLNYTSDEGIKNLAWMDTENALYNKILPKRAMLRNTKYEDYDGTVLEKMLGMYGTGWAPGIVERMKESVSS